MMCISERGCSITYLHSFYFSRLFFMKQVTCSLSTSNNYEGDYGNVGVAVLMIRREKRFGEMS